MIELALAVLAGLVCLILMGLALARWRDNARRHTARIRYTRVPRWSDVYRETFAELYSNPKRLDAYRQDQEVRAARSQESGREPSDIDAGHR